MLLVHPDHNLSVNMDMGKIILFRDDLPILISAPFQKLIRVVKEENSLRVEFTDCVLRILSTDKGFDFKFDPTGTISFKMEGAWFGHGELINQRLPLNRLMLPLSPMETFDNGPTGQSCKLSPSWYSSNGLLILARTPVSVGINQPPADYPRYSWTLGPGKGPFQHRPFEDFNHQGDGYLTLTGEEMHLSVLCLNDAKEAYHQMISIVGCPNQLPREELFRKPTWTTWARYKMDISESKVLQFADQIIENGYPHGVMEIDDRWQTNYGDIEFDRVRFPNPVRLIEELHRRNFKVTAWVVPFFDPGSSAFATGKRNNFLVKDQSGDPYFIPWWQGRGGLLDVTNPEALDWFYISLRALQLESGLDGYKFDAGEACFFPKDAVCNKPVSANEYTHEYINFIARQFKLTEVRSGWNNQSAPIFFRQWDKSSTWGADNGLRSVLSGILALGLTGYPFILPDMVGGNEYEEKADAELMIRWTQLNSLLPSIQFSLAPWEFPEECNRICLQYARLHVEYADRIIQIARESIKTGDPIIRPIWWGDPCDQIALNCDDQFLLGDDLLVAPILSHGMRARNIYLPAGRWRNIWSGEIFDGNQELQEFPAPLDTLPVFEKISS